MKIVILGLSVTSSWGNGHATTYRSLIQALSNRGHDVLFLERDVPWYAENRDLPDPPYCKLQLYSSLTELDWRFSRDVEAADLVMVGSFVPEGVAVAKWAMQRRSGICAFYDIDTPVTLAALQAGTCEYLSREIIEDFDLYLSFTGGPVLDQLVQTWGARRAEPLYCAVDPALYFPESVERRWDLGYLGTYSADRQPKLNRLLRAPAKQSRSRQFVVAGPLYPENMRWPGNVQRIQHLAAAEHRSFYNAQRFTLNITRAAMVRAGFSPSVRLFEAAACGVPIISDSWKGLEEFFSPGDEILLAGSDADVTGYLNDLPEADREAIGARARAKVLSQHTATHRAQELEAMVARELVPYPKQAVAL